MLKTVSSVINAIGALNYQGTWDAATNTPTLTSSVGTKGDYYVVSVAGSTNLDGTTLWGVGDWAVFNGSIWQKVDGGSTGDFTNLSVSGIANFSGQLASSVMFLNASKNLATDSSFSYDGVTQTLTSPKFNVSGGTANGVPYLNASKVLTTGTALTFDGTNFAVGSASAIGGGVVSAQGDLAAVNGYVFKNSAANYGNTNNFIRLVNSSNATVGGITHTAVTSLGIWGNTETVFLLGSTGATEGMRLTSTGLGIGTSSPGYKLDVSGTARATAANNNAMILQSGASGSYTSLALGRASAEIYFSIAAAANNFITGSAAGDLTLNNNTGNVLITAGGSSTQFYLNTSGNLGLGVTPSAWSSGWKVIQFGHCSVSTGSATGITGRFYANAYFDGTNDVYINSSSNYAAKYVLGASGQHQWFVAPVGTAGNTITFTQAMTLAASGGLSVGTTSDGGAGVISAQNQFRLAAASYSRVADQDGSGAFGGGYNFSLRGTTSPQYDSTGLLSGYYYSTDGSIRWYTGGSAASGTAAPERARIDSSGNLLVKKTAATTVSQIGVECASSGYFSTSMSASANTTTSLEVYSTGATAYRFYVGLGGTVYATSTTITAISDQRFKENIRDLDDGLSTVMALKPRKFDWKTGKGKDIKNDRGFIAQEFEQVLPDMVETWRDPAPEGEEPYKAVNPNLIPTLVKAIQEQQALIEQLTARVAQLEDK